MATITDLAPTGTLSFHAALAQAEVQARTGLDPALHERLSAAVALVKDGKTFQASDGAWEVDSTSQAGLVYRPNGTCPCQDHHFNKPRWCKHQLAMFLSQRVLTLMRQPAAPVVPALVEPWPDNDPEEPAPQSPPVETAPAPLLAPPVPLPEAPASVNVHLRIDGRDCQLTLRDSDEARLLQRLAVVLAQFPVPEPAKASSQGPPQGPEPGWCAIHNAAMHLNHGKDGRSWYSHRLPEGGFCKGRRK